jgi:4-hydroxymandelate oxidase
MRVLGPPAGGRGGAGPALRRGAHRVFEGTSAFARHPSLRPYLADLAGRAGLPLREEVLGTGQAYADMARPLVESVTAATGPVDLLVLAYGVHDVQPGRNTALHLASQCPGHPLAFAVTDQGPAAAFAALRVIGDHVAAGGCARALLVVAEQAALPYPLATPAPLPDRHAVAALLFEATADAAPARVRQHAGVPVDAVSTVLAAEIAELAGGRADVTLVVGQDVPLEAATIAAVRAVRRAPAGLPFTGLWSRWCEPDLASGTAAVILADHDPMLGYLSVASLQPAALARPAQAPARSMLNRPAVSRAGGGVAQMAIKD